MIAEPLFASIKARLIIVALLLVAAAFASIGLKLYFTSADLEEALKNADQLRGQKATLQSDLDLITADLHSSEKEVERLHREVQLTASLLSDRENKRKQIESAKQADKAILARVISHADSQTQHFADAHLPDDFIRMLKRASYCANSDNQADSLCDAASRANLPLPDP